MKSYISILENGNVVNGKRKIGTSVSTQWGQRKVVSNELIDNPKYDHIDEGEKATHVQ